MGNRILSMRIFTILLFLLFYTYAVLRYHFGKEVSWNDWLFIFNKAIAWMGFTLIALSIIKQSQLKRFNLSRKSLGMTGFVFAFCHAIFVLILFNSIHYPKFYTGIEINFLGWISLCIGIISLLIFTFPFIAALKNYPNKSKVFRLGKYGVLVNLFHPLVIGFAGWFSPSEWPYYLPPITMLAVLTGIFVLCLRLIKN